MQPQPLLIVISGLSGAGKDTVVRALHARGFPIHFVVTATSRERRQDEVDGRDYLFVSKQAFEQMVAEDELLEYALVYGQYKGVPKEQVRQALASGKDVIMRLDVQGAASIRKQCPGAVLVFLAVSEETLLQRLKDRRTESEEQLQLRLKTAREELNCIHEFDYLVANENGDLDETVNTIEAIIRAEHHRVMPRRVTL
ncbi:MAG: guanylate kinase [Chloroflexota bacterium]